MPDSSLHHFTRPAPHVKPRNFRRSAIDRVASQKNSLLGSRTGSGELEPRDISYQWAVWRRLAVVPGWATGQSLAGIAVDRERFELSAGTCSPSQPVALYDWSVVRTETITSHNAVAAKFTNCGSVMTKLSSDWIVVMSFDTHSVV